MNAGGVDESCKSNGNLSIGDCDYIKVKEVLVSVADEVVTRRNLLQSRE